MNKSYRSTYEIMEFAKEICHQPSLEMVERHGEKPGILHCESMEREIASIAALINQFEEGENEDYTVILCNGTESLNSAC